MKQKCIIFSIALTATTLLSGCATTNDHTKPDISIPSNINYDNSASLSQSMDQLNQMAKSALKTQQMIAYANNAAQQSKVTYMGALKASVSQESVPIGWERKVNISNYTGGYKSVLEKVAKKANYDVEISSMLSQPDPTVSINTQGPVKAITVLHNIVSALPEAYNVTLNPVNQTVYVSLNNSNGVN